MTVTLYWRAREPVAGDYSPFLHVTTTPQHTYAQADSLHPGNIPTRTWPAGKFVADTHTLAIPPGTPPGDFTLRVGLWQPAAGRRQLVLAEDGTVLGDAVELAEPLRVAAAEPGTLPPTDDMVDAAPGVWLAGATREPDGVFGDAVGLLKLTLLWQAGAGDLPRYDAALRLLDADGGEVMRAVEPVTDGLHPPDAWRAGEQVRDVHGFFLDESVPPGTYRIEVGLVPPGEGEPVRWIEAGGFERTLP